jgi:hypothetical protein
VNTSEIVLVYVGTVLIALEFVGGSRLLSGIKDLQALVGMLLAWPFRPYLNDISSNSSYFKIRGVKWPLSIILTIYALLFLIIAWPMTLVFYLLYFILTPIELVHVWVNKLYLISQREYRPTIGYWTRFSLSINKTPENVTEEKVIKEIQKREIPVLPITGIILITISFIMQLM